MALHSAILTGMRTYFLARQEVRAVIGERFYDVVAPERIKVLENPNMAYAPRSGRFCEYQQMGARIPRNLSGASKLRDLLLDFTWYAQTPALAREAWEAFWGLWGNNLYSGTWNTLAVTNTYWDLDTESNGFDDLTLMATHTCQLILRYRST